MSKLWCWILGVLLSLSAAQSVAAIDESDLLPVDDAFALRVSASDQDRIRVTWTIAEGYYLYRHRISIKPDDAFESRALQLPAGEKHHDEFFGNVETYRNQMSAVVLGTAAPHADRVTLTVKYQGCADVGVCYPPQTRVLTVALPAGEDSSTQQNFETLGQRLGLSSATPMTRPQDSNQALPLPAEQAFGFEAIAGDHKTLLLRFTPAPGYYLYRDRTVFSLAESSAASTDKKINAAQLGQAQWPKGVAHHDEHFGDVVVYFDPTDVALNVRRSSQRAQSLTLTTTFQGCQNNGICYPPMTRRVSVTLPADSGKAPYDAATNPYAASEKAPPATSATQSTNAPDQPTSQANSIVANPLGMDSTQPGATSTGLAEDSRIALALRNQDRWWTLAGFFGAGLLLAFTPCVLPMIPILSGLIAGQGTRVGTRRALLLSFVYVLANALVFTVAGIVAGLAGANLQAAFQTPWIITAFAALFVALALSAFGLYELQLPASLRSKLGAISDKQRGGSLWGAAAMGALSALIVGPCVAPPLAAAVLYIGQTQDPILGGSALFLLGMGMGVPLLAFGAAAGHGMPTSGPWMVTAQRVFGFVFLALAVWMLSRILPEPVTLGLYGALALAAAVWCFNSLLTQAPRVRAFACFVGLLLGIVGVAEMIGALSSAGDPLQPLAGLRRDHQAMELNFRMIKSTQDLDREIAAAHAQGKPLLFDFYADWCVACKEMEKYTFTESAVHAALDDFVLLKADVTANDAIDQALMKRFGIIGPPATLFFRNGKEQRELRLIGFEKADDFVRRAQRAQVPRAALNQVLPNQQQISE